jgi:hypothetical protein
VNTQNNKERRTKEQFCQRKLQQRSNYMYNHSKSTSEKEYKIYRRHTDVIHRLDNPDCKATSQANFAKVKFEVGNSNK